MLHRKTLLSFFICLILLPPALTVRAQVLDEKKSAEIDQYLQAEMKKRHIPGLAVGIYHKGNILKKKGYGLADVQNASPVKASTRFELASIGKQFTASGIMVLVQERKVNLDDEIHKYLPHLPQNWKGATVRNLLTHTSGLPHMDHGFTGFRNGTVSRSGLNVTTEIALKAASTDTLAFTPGEKFLYSDVGFFLLGLITEKASGMTWREFVQKKLLNPAGMTNTYLLDQTTIHSDEARGYTLRKPYELINTQRVYDFEVPSHYGVHSNVEDMAKWDAVLSTEKILTNKSKEMMWSAMKLNSGKLHPYGFGWRTWNVGGKTFISHTSVTGTEIIRAINDSITVVVLTNLARGNSGNVNSWGLAPKISEMLGVSPYINESYTSLSGAKVTTLSKKQIAEMAGTYRAPNNAAGKHKIYAEDGKLFYTAGSEVSQLVALSDGSFLVLGLINESLLFPLPQEKGKPKHIRLYFNGQATGILEKEENRTAANNVN